MTCIARVDMSSNTAEEDLVREINFLKGLISSHKTERGKHKGREATVGGSAISGSSYKWRAVGHTSRAKVTVANLEKTTKSKLSSGPFGSSQSQTGPRSAGERHGNLVYRPFAKSAAGYTSGAKPINTSASKQISTESSSVSLAADFRSSRLSKGKDRKVARKNEVKISPKRSSKYVFVSASVDGVPSSEAISPTTTVFKERSSCNSKPSSSYTSPVIGTQAMPPTDSTSSRSPPISVVCHGSSSSKSHSSPSEQLLGRAVVDSTSGKAPGRTRKRSAGGRSRKRSLSKAESAVVLPTKRLKSGFRSPALYNARKYTWRARSISNKYRSRLHHLPTKSQLCWRRKSLEAAERTGDAASSPPSAGAQVSVSPSVQKMSGSLRRRSLSRNTRYKWRKSSSSTSVSSKNTDKHRKTLQSPVVLHGRFKLTRASFLRHSHYSSGSVFRSFGRRTNYLWNSSSRSHLQSHGPHSSVHTLSLAATPTRKQKKVFSSKNRVWVASGAEGSSSGAHQMAPAVSLSPVPLRRKSHRRGSKTRMCNRQWFPAGKTRTKIDSSPRVLRRRSSEGKGGGNRVQEVSLLGERFVMDAAGRRMVKRLPSVSTPRAVSRSISISDNSSSVKRLFASQAVRRSMAFVWHSKQKTEQRRQSKQYCVYFNRFGKCKRGDSCPYIHDPDRVAICTKLLRGLCDKTDGSCPFSHKISKEKMPVCSFFLRGACSKDECPYLHVSVGKEAGLCDDFIHGYCPRGERCTEQHVLECPEFSTGGSCPRGKRCPLRHKRRTKKRDREQETEKVAEHMKEPFAFKRALKKQHLPQPPSSSSFSGLNDSTIITPQQLEYIPLDNEADFIAL